MIASLHGTLLEKEPTRLVLDCHGIGLEVRVPLSTSRRVGKKGDEVKLLIVTRFPRAGVELYGFLEKAEQDVFRLLISVRGVGPKAGLNLLSRLSPDEVLDAIARKRIELVRSVPGIGPKRAARIMGELEEKTAPVQKGIPILADAESALTSLGLTHKEARGRLARVETNEEMTLEEILKLALRQL
ncbi:Holliday junction branch migration protein RuvA [candidate division WOR-3 bacterium JGI_Cruoil_03_51_56]|uniref:Holliday junction branch migration complex subunit RuvA n=1 Tax=candidate division WOR-3 bacterium JGI_Cruoil_03_51_56 TaxID=1973747 RepID=A0A235BQN4_UNCW3|nr:MAG: Holliday junction branch migration protein RuvA [candidate division WOR-3 bacterium JGI_Cruoil_03_51_56]